jgi:hypothetical protein
MNILIIYKYIYYPLRLTLDDHLYSFYRYKDKNTNVFYLPLDTSKASYWQTKKFKLPSYLKKLKFDVIVFHYGFAGGRTTGDNWKNAIQDIQYFKNSSALKVLFVQDEMYYTNPLNDFINSYGIDIIYSVAPESEWHKIYNKVDTSKVVMAKTLTGFMEPRRFKQNEKKFRNVKRTIDIGYRARRLPPWYGRHGFRKTEIADVFNKVLAHTNLKTDISTREEDTLYGDKWDEFLYMCRYTLGVESGASVHDPDGTINKKGYEYIKKHPEYTFEEVESILFPGMDGNLKLFAISPRVFECAVSKTCQVLIEGEYDNILQPNIHYIPVAKDFSNVDEVVKKLRDEELRQKLVNQTYQDLILSGDYTYKKFIEDFLILCGKHLKAPETKSNIGNKVLSIYSFYKDRLSWRLVKWDIRKGKYLNRWYFIDMAKKIKQSNLIFRFSYKILKKLFAIG